MSTPNTLGAVVFVLYVLGALVLTAYIVFGIYGSYRQSTKSSSRDDAATSKVQTVATLAVVSFAILSYHMLSFLIVYYQAWAFEHGTHIPDTFQGVITRPWHIWIWLKDSTLFLSFAETICNDPARYWWTQNALVYSMVWSIYMAIEGTERSVPNLAAYFMLAQILPTSFTQNLFILATLFSNGKRENRSTNSRKSSDPKAPFSTATLLAAVVAYLGSLWTATNTIETQLFIPMVLLARLLLFAPYFLVVSSDTAQARPLASNLFPCAFATACGVAAMAWQSHVVMEQKDNDIQSLMSRLASAIHDDPSVSALGYDFIIGLLSLAIFRYQALLAQA